MSINITLPKVNLSFEFKKLAEYREVLLFNPGGIYAFYDSDERCLYVGKSKSMYQRLLQHKSSNFYDEVETVEIRFIQDPNDRDIYETFAIKTLNPIYNIDKVYRSPASQSVRDAINDLYDELRIISTLKNDLLVTIEDLQMQLRPPGRRRNPNFDPDDYSLSEAFYDYIGEMAAYNSGELSDLQDELILCETKLEEVLEDERNIKQQIERYYEKLIV